MKKIKLMVHEGKNDKHLWVVDTQAKKEIAYVELFQLLDSEGCYFETGISIDLLKKARSGNFFAAKDILEQQRHQEYEGYYFTTAVDPCARDFGHLPFVQTVVCARSSGKPIKSPWKWERIWSSREHGWGDVELWVAGQDLKEEFVSAAKCAFGKRLMQIVRLGAYPEVEYQEG